MSKLLQTITLALLLVFTSCSNENEEILEALSDSSTLKEENTDSCHMTPDSIGLGDVILYNGDSILNKKMDNQRRNLLKSRSLMTGLETGSILESNLYAIQGMRFNLLVKDVVYGCNITHTNLLSNKTNREAGLNELKTGASWEYYLKVNRGMVDDKYLIYGVATNTPLVVANYTNDKVNKILYLNKDDVPTAPAALWYLVPSKTLGYFNIASYTHIGQSDPNNDFSLFNYVWEAQPKDKIRYAELVNGKAQQLFKIALLDKFQIESIEYHTDSAIVKPYPSHTEKYTFQHRASTTESKVLQFPVRVKDKSVFHESSALAIPLLETSTKFQRPVALGGNKSILDENSEKDAIYQNVFQEIQCKDYVNEIVMKPRSYVEIEIEYRMFELRVPYTITASAEYEDYSDNKVKKKTTVKITGYWVGYSHADFEIYEPKRSQPRYFDIATGEELFD